MQFSLKKKEECFNKTIRLPENIINRLEDLSAKNNVSFNRIVLEMIEFALNNMEN